MTCKDALGSGNSDWLNVLLQKCTVLKVIKLQIGSFCNFFFFIHPVRIIFDHTKYTAVRIKNRSKLAVVI